MRRKFIQRGGWRVGVGFFPARSLVVLLMVVACGTTVVDEGGLDPTSGGSASKAAGGASAGEDSADTQGGDAVRLPDGGEASGGQPGELAGGAGTLQAGGAGAPGLGECQLQSIEVFPSELSETDRCLAVHACDNGVTLKIDCDGENDGTNTSICECMVGAMHRSPDGVFEGEAPESCEAALQTCQALFNH
jgi:hypothetical protein